MAKALSLFAEYVRPEVPMCPEIMILDAINNVGIAFCKATRLLQEKVNIVTVVGQASYPLTLSAGFDVEEVLRVARDQYFYLTPSSEAEFTDAGYDRLSGTSAYFYLNDQTLVLGMLPVAVETLEVLCKSSPSSSATVLPDELYTKYENEIAAGAKALLMQMTKKPWSDQAKALENQAMFDAGIAKENIRHAKGGVKNRLRSRLHIF